jgi:hypothetical protein
MEQAIEQVVKQNLKNNDSVDILKTILLQLISSNDYYLKKYEGYINQDQASSLNYIENLSYVYLKKISVELNKLDIDFKTACSNQKKLKEIINSIHNNDECYIVYPNGEREEISIEHVEKKWIVASIEQTINKYINEDNIDYATSTVADKLKNVLLKLISNNEEYLRTYEVFTYKDPELGSNYIKYLMNQYFEKILSELHKWNIDFNTAYMDQKIWNEIINSITSNEEPKDLGNSTSSKVKKESSNNRNGKKNVLDGIFRIPPRGKEYIVQFSIDGVKRCHNFSKKENRLFIKIKNRLLSREEDNIYLSKKEKKYVIEKISETLEGKYNDDFINEVTNSLDCELFIIFAKLDKMYNTNFKDEYIRIIGQQLTDTDKIKLLQANEINISELSLDRIYDIYTEDLLQEDQEIEKSTTVTNKKESIRISSNFTREQENENISTTEEQEKNGIRGLFSNLIKRFRYWTSPIENMSYEEYKKIPINELNEIEEGTYTNERIIDVHKEENIENFIGQMKNNAEDRIKKITHKPKRAMERQKHTRAQFSKTCRSNINSTIIRIAT